MGRRWLIGVAWVGTVTVGGAVLLATGLAAPESQPGPDDSHAQPPPANAAGPGSGSLGSMGGGPAPGPAVPLPGAPGSDAPPAAGTLGVTVPGPLAPPQRDRGQAPAPPATAAAPASGQAGGPDSGTSPPLPARVAAVSYLLDILESVSRVSPGVANGAAATVLGAALQGLPAPVQETVTSGSAKLAEQLSTDVPRTIEDVRRIAAQLSTANPEVNQALSLAATALSGIATPAISPLDETARQLSRTLEALAEPAPSMSP